MADKDKIIRRALMAAESLGDHVESQIEGPIYTTANPKRVLIKSNTKKSANGIVVPRHMWFGLVNKHGRYTRGMKDINKQRAAVYGSEHRDPLSISQFSKVHEDVMKDHFAKKPEEQRRLESEALQRLRAAGHLSKNADTLDKSEKLDTVNFEKNPGGGGYEAFAAKGIAGHAVYTSGVGDDAKFHIMNTCPGQTSGCAGGVDKNGNIDTSLGTCFAPNAESQYVNAAVKRACHAQAKADPAMTGDWILAHIGSLRKRAEDAHKRGNQVLFRPNVVDESDRTSRTAIKNLNRQFAAADVDEKDKIRPIISNQYGKTDELHDPENGIFVTASNVGPKVKDGRQISENIHRDRKRIAETILATNKGEDLVNEQGNKTPPKGSYLVTNVKRYSPTDERMKQAFKHAKYWSTGREQSDLTAEEKAEGAEAHYDGNGNLTTPDQAHYGHTTLNGRRYDYQKQHILHPRMVQVGWLDDEETRPKMVPTDSRFKDEEHLPEERFMSRNGKKAGHILMTTPTESTSGVQHDTSFTHPVDEAHFAHAQANNGEYQIDAPELQEAARGREYAAPQKIDFKRRARATGGAVSDDEPEPLEEHMSAFPEQSYSAQRHNAHRTYPKDEQGDHLPHQRTNVVDRALTIARHALPGLNVSVVRR